MLLEVDRELRRNPGVTLAEGAMSFERRRQVFASSLGSLIDQTRYLSGVGYAALSYKDGEIQKRSYPNSFGGQHQLKGYELVEEWGWWRTPRVSPMRRWRCTARTNAPKA